MCFIIVVIERKSILKQLAKIFAGKMSKEEETYNVPLDAVNEGNLEYATVEGVNLNYPMNVEEPVYDEVNMIFNSKSSENFNFTQEMCFFCLKYCIFMKCFIAIFFVL